MAKLDPAIVAHLEDLGFVRPAPIVVSALMRAGAPEPDAPSRGSRDG